MKGRHGSTQHMREVQKHIDELIKKGYRVIDLQGKSPDAIALKDDKIYAVEVLGRQYKRGKGWIKKWSHVSKKKNYDMFDDVIIFSFRRNTPLKIGGDTISTGTQKGDCHE